MHLKERMKGWPGLAAHRFEKIEEVLLDHEARLVALEPKKKEEPKKAEPFVVPASSFFPEKEPKPVQPVMPEVKPLEPVNPLDGTNLKS